jgi:arginine N-succinyltransferase
MVHQALRLGFNYDGPTEIGGLILLPEYRRHRESLGKLLSYVRFLFISMHREIFRNEVISELMPPLEADGTSKLWKHLGKGFTGLTYQEADRLSKNNKEFIWALFPHGMIFTSMFPADVREVIGKVGPATEGVRRILERIGFSYANKIDPFDGGPHFVARTDDITLIRNARQMMVSGTDSADDSRPWAILATESDEPGARFRAIGTRVIPRGEDSVAVPAPSWEQLGITAGDSLWMVTE